MRASEMHDQGTAQRTPRLPELDGLRGLAALIVFIYHFGYFQSLLPYPGAAFNTPVHILWDGIAAVDLFFVLSGFVLALPFVGDKGQPIQYFEFVVRRAFRILPAYWLSLLVAIALKHFLFDQDGLGQLHAEIQKFWATPPERLVDHVVLAGWWSDDHRINPVTRVDGAIQSINPVIWSLIVEFRMSLIFPVLLLIITRIRRVSSAAFIVLAAVVAGLLVPVLWAMPLFVFGGLLAKFRHRIAQRCAELGSAPLCGLWLVGIVLCDVRYSIPGITMSGLLMNYASGLGASLIICLVLAGGARRFLNCGPIAFLGRISYGFYLLHFPIPLTVTSIVLAVMPAGVGAWTTVAAIGFAATVLLSAASHSLVEAPAQRAIRWMTSRARHARGQQDPSRLANLRM